MRTPLISVDQKKAEKELTDYKFALDISSIVSITDQKGIIKYVNDNFCKISKYSVEELIGQDHRIMNSGYHPKSFIRNLWVTIFHGKVWRDELCNKAKDGTIFWVDTTIVPFLNDEGNPYQYLTIQSDITERKLEDEEIVKLHKESIFQNEEKGKRAAELIIAITEISKAVEELKEQNSKLKKLPAYLQNVREEERKYIARELHDEFGQLASALKMDINWLNINIVALEENAKYRIANANKTIEALITSIRNTASRLRPSVLDHFGLNAALQWHCTEFQNLNDIPCTFEPGFDDKDLTMDRKTELYRMAQESLTNVMRHAKASNVTVTTKEDADNVYLNITDNGKGFDSNQKKNTLGLIGLRERALSLSGELHIESIIGKGTIICAVVPKK